MTIKELAEQLLYIDTVNPRYAQMSIKTVNVAQDGSGINIKFHEKYFITKKIEVGMGHIGQSPFVKENDTLNKAMKEMSYTTGRKKYEGKL